MISKSIYKTALLWRELDALLDHDTKGTDGFRKLKWNNRNKDHVARFLKWYAVFVFDHTVKEDVFFGNIQNKRSISEEEEIALLKHYELCKNGQNEGDDKTHWLPGKETMDELVLPAHDIQY